MNTQTNFTKTTPPRKVITIPIHFITSTTNLTNSAVKIQKIFRGFLVRSRLNKITQIALEVNRLEKFIRDNRILLKRNEKEKLRVNESLMKLLLRLDSVNGVCDSVRDRRKAVIKTVIRLQELVDDIASGNREGCVEEVVEGSGEVGADCVDNVGAGDVELEEIEGVGESLGGDRGLIEETGDCGGRIKDNGGMKGDENWRSWELLERMMEDNEKMMGMMTELFERNERQVRVLESLSRRVEQLERGFIGERKLRSRIKKRGVDEVR